MNHNLSDNEEEEKGENVSGTTAGKHIMVVNLLDRGKILAPNTDEQVEDADAGAGAGSSAQGLSLPPKYTLAVSYVLAGEHLLRTILKEAEADLLDWQFVSNTKDVVVMKRLRPIKKKNLLKVRGPSIQQPSPSPQLSEDRSRGLATHAPGILTLDGASSTTSSAASSFMQATGPAPKTYQEVTQHCFMGRGIIDAPAEVIFDIVRKPEQRPLYDSMMNECILYENFAVLEEAPDFEKTGLGNLLVYYHLFETNRCFLRYARDFCVLQYAKKVQVGKTIKYVVVGASINHPGCPTRELIERATLDLFGWVVEPIKGKQSKVTYMMHIDFGLSGVPTHLLNTISFRQPLCVYYLRKYIQSILPEKNEQQQQEKASSLESKKSSTEL